MSGRFVRSHPIRVGQVKDGTWEARYFSITVHGSTRTKVLHRLAAVLNDIDRFADRTRAKRTEGEA